MAADREGRLPAWSNAELARRLTGGEPGAFACLVDRYGGDLLTVTGRILGNRADAMDAVQEVLVKVHERIGSLRDPSKLRGWLMNVARNYALNQLRRRRHEPHVVQLAGSSTVIETVNHVADGLASPLRQAEVAELRDEVATALDALSRDYGEIVRMHYLEGRGLAEIAESLGVPIGTAKWRISRARALLRKELMMSELTDAHRHESEVSPLLEVRTINGHSGPVERLQPREVCKTLLAQQVLFAVRKVLKTPQEIAREVKADAAYVREHLELMTEAEVLEEHEGRYRANCILFDADDGARLRHELRDGGAEVAGAVKMHEVRLAEALAQTSPARRGFDGGYLRWIVLPTMVLNLGLSRLLGRVKSVDDTPPFRPDGGAWFFWPSLIGAALPSHLGCNLSPGSDGHAQYWNSEFGVQITRLSGTETFLLHRLPYGPIGRESVLDVFGEEGLAGALDKAIVRVEGDEVVANVPIFTPADGDLLDPVLSAITDGIVAKAYVHYPDDIYAILDELGFGFVRHDYCSHAQVLGQIGAVPALMKAGILAKPPLPLPKAWGFFAWTGVFAPMEWPPAG